MRWWKRKAIIQILKSLFWNVNIIRNTIEKEKV